MDTPNPETEPTSIPIQRQQQEAMINRCGQCKHGITVSRNLDDPLQCRYAPPSISMAFDPRSGQPIMFSAFPQVKRQDPACHSGFTLKLTLQQ